MREIIALGLTVLVVGMVALVARSKRQGARALPPPPVQADDSSEATASTPPSFEGARSAARAGTSRELRAAEIAEHVGTHVCLYCPKHASRQIPQLVLIRPLLDKVYLWANVVPINRWKIDETPDISFPHLLCEQHHAIARSHLERRIAENQVDYAGFVERQRNEMYEYTTYALDERMLADVNSIKGLDNPKRGRRTKTLAANDASNNVRTIGAAKIAS